MDLTPFHVELNADRGGCTLHLVGELDIASAEQLDAELTRVAATRPATITLDASGLTFCDSSGLAVFARWKRFTDDNGCLFTVQNPSASLSRLLELTRLDVLVATHL